MGDRPGPRSSRSVLRYLPCLPGMVGVLVLLLLMGYQAVVDTSGEQHSSAAIYLGLCLALVLGAVQTMVSLRYRAASAPSDREELPSGRLSEKPLDYLVSLLNVSRAVARHAQLPDLYHVIVEACRDCFECDEVSLMLLDREKGELHVAAFAGHRDPARIRGARVRLGEQVAGKVAMERVPLILGREIDTKQFSGFQEKSRAIESSMVAPIVVRDEVVGVLNASSGEGGQRYGESDLRVLCLFAEHAGIVTEKARDLERVSRIVEGLQLGDDRPDSAPRAA